MSTLIFSRLCKAVPKQIVFGTEKYKLTFRSIILLPSLTNPKEASTWTQNLDAYRYDITKTIKYISRDNSKLNFDQQTFKLVNPTGKPLCLLLTWLNAEGKHVDKYVNVYLQQGFDVLAVALPLSLVYWPPLWKEAAENLAKFLHSNTAIAPLMLHGFSGSSLMWGLVSQIISADSENYRSLMKQIVSQVWDSAIDFEVSQVNFPLVLFPKSVILQRVASIYYRLHVLIFYESYTISHRKGYSEYLNAPCSAPALILVSSTDPLGRESSNRMLSEKWKSLGVKVTFKCWEKSPHVQHLTYHPEEYLTLLHNHMDQAGLLKYKDQIIRK